jgi:tetratricopeptide (TPR) repeat protein
VARALELRLSGEEQRRLRKSHTNNTEAFEAYIKCRYFWNKRTPGGLRKGLEYAQQAIDLDPAYAPAYVGLADSYSLLGAQHSVLRPAEVFPKAQAAAERALEIDPNLAEGYASLGFVNCCSKRDWQASERNLRRAIELKPNYPTAHHWYGEILAVAGRFEESKAALARALALDPLSLAISTDLGATYYYAREYDSAVEQLREALEIDAGFVRAHLIMAAVEEQRGEFEEATARLRRVVEFSGDDAVVLSILAHSLAVAGKTQEARRLAVELQERAAQRYLSACNLAMIATGLLDFDDAYRWLERAFKEGDVNLIWLGVEPRFDPLRGDSRFQDLLRRVGLPLAHG